MLGSVARSPLSALLVLGVCSALAPLGTSRAAAQEAVLRGFVAEEGTGIPIASARVILIGANAEAETRADGTFQFDRPPLGRHFVRVVASGYPAVVEEVELTAGDEVLLPVFVTSAAAVLEEILVIAEAPRAVIKQAAMTAAELLARQLPGLSVFAMGGREHPTGLDLRARGTFGVGEPIIVLDGVRFSGGVGQAMDRLRQLSAGDVKSIRLLRGPSAAFLYGSPHGVVYVQTHEGPPLP